MGIIPMAQYLRNNQNFLKLREIKAFVSQIALTANTLLEMLMEILAVVEKFPMNNCVVSFKVKKKKFDEMHEYYSTDAM
jgi:hypothetical protein